jgi:hypothetical protein
MMLRTNWVLVVMDHYTRRIIGFGIHAGVVNGEALCRMFKQAIRGVTTLPRYLSSDHDPLYLSVAKSRKSRGNGSLIESATVLLPPVRGEV